MMDAISDLERLADAAAGAGDFGRARALLERAAAEPGATPGLFNKLAAVRTAAGDREGALDALDRGLAIRPFDFALLLSRAMVCERLGRADASEQYGRALAQAPDEIPPELGPAVARAQQLWQAHQEATEERLGAAVLAPLDSEERARVDRFVTNRSRRTRHFHSEPTHFHYPGLPEIEFFPRSTFPQLAALEAQTDAILAEFEALVAAEAADMVPYIRYPDRVPLQQFRALNNSTNWSAIHLLQNGKRIEANARHCPVTMAAVEAMPQPDIPGGSPNAMFSLLAPHTHIPPHTGVTNTRLVCHLPLIVPPSGCGFRCGASVREWHKGEAFVFDDTIEHEAWNESDALRVVLILDLWNPALSPAERQAVGEVIGAVGVSFAGA